MKNFCGHWQIALKIHGSEDQQDEESIGHLHLVGKELWSQYEATLAGLPKINNSVEGWHKGFLSLLTASHPTIWRLIYVLKKEQGLIKIKINQFIVGQEPPANEKNIEKSLRISNIVTKIAI